MSPPNEALQRLDPDRVQPAVVVATVALSDEPLCQEPYRRDCRHLGRLVTRHIHIHRTLCF